MPGVLSQRGIESLTRDMLASAKNAPREFQRARIDMSRAANTEAARQITAIYNLTQARVKEGLTVRQTAAGVVVAGARRTVTFTSYRFRKSAKGLRGKILKAGKQVTIPGAFIAPGIGGGSVAFFRNGAPREMQAGRYQGKVRQPLSALHGPSIADALKDTRNAAPLRERILARTGEQLRKRLARIRGR